MCGILALVDTPWQESLETALRPLACRGPDAEHIWRDSQAAFGHRRLAVIDLAGGAQPMPSEDGRYVIAYNGEIYNFQSVRRDLEARGRRFATRSDTEVILLGYAEWGADVVRRLDGIFAFAIWDTRERRLFAARDRLGIKPLFYSTHKGLTLASTLAPFLSLAGFPRELDYEALRDYLAFQTPLAPHSFLKAVRQLPPAHWLEWREGLLRIEGYWSIPPPAGASGTPQLDELDALLARTVKEQLVADVPVGSVPLGWHRQQPGGALHGASRRAAASHIQRALSRRGLRRVARRARSLPALRYRAPRARSAAHRVRRAARRARRARPAARGSRLRPDLRALAAHAAPCHGSAIGGRRRRALWRLRALLSTPRRATPTAWRSAGCEH
jgi:hypothetical protein